MAQRKKCDEILNLFAHLSIYSQFCVPNEFIVILKFPNSLLKYPFELHTSSSSSSQKAIVQLTQPIYLCSTITIVYVYFSFLAATCCFCSHSLSFSLSHRIVASFTGDDTLYRCYDGALLHTIRSDDIPFFVHPLPLPLPLSFWCAGKMVCQIKGTIVYEGCTKCDDNTPNVLCEIKLREKDDNIAEQQQPSVHQQIKWNTKRHTHLFVHTIRRWEMITWHPVDKYCT